MDKKTKYILVKKELINLIRKNESETKEEKDKINSNLYSLEELILLKAKYEKIINN